MLTSPQILRPPKNLPALKPHGVALRFMVSRETATPDLAFLAGIQCLSRIESELESEYGKNLVPFGLLMSSLSPTYRKIMNIAADLGIKVKPILKPRFQFMNEFDPLSGEAGFSGIKENLRWYESRPLNKLLARDLKLVLQFHFALHHDLLHVIFSKLIVPPADRDLTDYFLLTEALAFPMELYISRELGEHLSYAFSTINLTYRHYQHRDMLKGYSDKDVFIGLFMSHLASLKRWPKNKSRARFRGRVPFFDDSEFGFQPIFSETVTNDWLREYQGHKPPTVRRNKKLKFRQIAPSTCLIDELLEKPEELDGLWEWLNQLLNLSQGKSRRPSRL